MNILITGGTGFIGNSIFLALVQDHKITIASRKPIEGYENWRQVDFEKENDWNALLQDIDMVINAVGIIEGDFQQIQVTAPAALFKACIQKNIRILNISAIGAEKKIPPTEFLRTKKITDEMVMHYPLGKVLYPGIVIGKGGKSTQFFTAIAQLPLIPLFDDKPLPLIHITQLTSLIKKSVVDFENLPAQNFALAQGEKLSELLSALKGKKARFITIPKFFISFLFKLFPKMSFGLFNKDTLSLFESTNVSDYSCIAEKTSSKIQRGEQHNSFFLPLIALVAISFIWLWSGISSLVSMDECYKLMAEIGADKQLSKWLILAGSTADILLGIAVFNKRFRKQVILMQIIFILIYTLILSFLAPVYWIHPFGVLSKNIPLIVLSLYVFNINRTTK